MRTTTVGSRTRHARRKMGARSDGERSEDDATATDDDVAGHDGKERSDEGGAGRGLGPAF